MTLHKIFKVCYGAQALIHASTSHDVLLMHRHYSALLAITIGWEPMKNLWKTYARNTLWKNLWILQGLTKYRTWEKNLWILGPSCEKQMKFETCTQNMKKFHVSNLWIKLWNNLWKNFTESMLKTMWKKLWISYQHVSLKKKTFCNKITLNRQWKHFAILHNLNSFCTVHVPCMRLN